jgi:CDP-diacylglycerol--serine O-phosphatidyltransferase
MSELTVPIEPTNRRRGAYIVPAMFTTANIFAGFYAAIATLRGYELVHTDWAAAANFFDNAAKAIGWAVLFDALDGRIARMTKTTSEFGVELDSLADVISFGVAPALLAFAWGYGTAPPAYSPDFAGVAWATSFIFLMCGAFRLARFNAHARRPAIDGKKDKKQFVGLPIPAAAALIAAIVHFVPKPLLAVGGREVELLGQSIQLDRSFWSLGLLALVFGLAMMMISTVRHTSFKSPSVGSMSPRVTLLILSLLVCSIYFYSRWVLLVMAVVYVSHGLVGKLIGRLTRSHPPEHSLPEEELTH